MLQRIESLMEDNGIVITSIRMELCCDFLWKSSRDQAALIGFPSSWIHDSTGVYYIYIIYIYMMCIQRDTLFASIQFHIELRIAIHALTVSLVSINMSTYHSVYVHWPQHVHTLRLPVSCGFYSQLQIAVLVEICTYVYMDVSENSGTPKSSILTGFPIINHIFWGTTIFGNSHIDVFKKQLSMFLHCFIPSPHLHLPLLLRSSVAACQSTRRWAQLYIVGRPFLVGTKIELP